MRRLEARVSFTIVRESWLLRHIVNSRWFVLADMILILLSGAIWLTGPEIGPWVILIALVPWGIRLISGRLPFQRTPLDGLVAVFLITAWVGYWAAYDRTTAWTKVWFIVLAVILYYALSAQPELNRAWISFLFFGIGVGVCLYFFLTHDFLAIPRKLEIVNRIGIWIMSIRPQFGWIPIHPNYVAGIAAVTVPFVFYPIGQWRNSRGRFPLWLAFLVLAGLIVAGITLVMATSRGVLLAVLGGLGAWFLWKLFENVRLGFWKRKKAYFPIALLLYLCAVTAFLYLGPAQPAGAVSGTSHYANGSRAELVSRSLYLVQDFPLTGGGLGSFPGLFSQYILNIPFYYLPNSHNLFLDVAIEQGVGGGLSFLFLYIAALWSVSGSIGVERGDKGFQWIVVFSLLVAMIHGMVDNYLYNGAGTVLALSLVGLSMNQRRGGEVPVGSSPGVGRVFAPAALLLAVLFILLRPIQSMWHANLGAVQLAKLELDGFPRSEWAESVPGLEAAEASLRTALRFDPLNRTANHRLGLISMLHGDFESAADYLEAAREQSPGHRGIVKSLGYCYVWLAEFDKARMLLSEISEAQGELNVYVWWWDVRGRQDLSANAGQLVSQWNGDVQQP